MDDELLESMVGSPLVGQFGALLGRSRHLGNCDLWRHDLDVLDVVEASSDREHRLVTHLDAVEDGAEIVEVHPERALALKRNQQIKRLIESFVGAVVVSDS